MPGCALLGGGATPLDTYELTSASPDERGPRHSRTQVLIAEPTALKALDSQNIVIKPSAAEIQFLKGAQWSDRLPKVVQARLAQAFQESGRLGGVGKPGEGLAIDYQIITEIRSFEIRLDGGDRAGIGHRQRGFHCRARPGLRFGGGRDRRLVDRADVGGPL